MSVKPRHSKTAGIHFNFVREILQIETGSTHLKAIHLSRRYTSALCHFLHYHFTAEHQHYIAGNTNIMFNLITLCEYIIFMSMIKN